MPLHGAGKRGRRRESTSKGRGDWTTRAASTRVKAHHGVDRSSQERAWVDGACGHATFNPCTKGRRRRDCSSDSISDIGSVRCTSPKFGGGCCKCLLPNARAKAHRRTIYKPADNRSKKERNNAVDRSQEQDQMLLSGLGPALRVASRGGRTESKLSCRVPPPADAAWRGRGVMQGGCPS